MTAAKLTEKELNHKPSKDDKDWLQREMDSLPADDFLDFRIDEDGTITKGHYESRMKLKQTSLGSKFKIKNVNGKGLSLHNISWGWHSEEVIATGATVKKNHVGFDFEGEPKTAEQVADMGSKWLREHPA